MYRILLIVFISMCFMMQANAKVIFSQDKIKVTAGVKKWSRDIKLRAQSELLSYKNDKDGYTECRRTEEANNVVLCGTFLQRDMNDLILRATIYSEGGIGGHKAGDIIPFLNKELLANRDIVGGHDLRSKELLAFYKKINEKCKVKPTYCLTENEKSFYKNIIQPLQKTDKTFVIITFSVQSSLAPNQIVSHEFLHALYFLDPGYKKKINKFWNKSIKKAERENIKKALKKIGYNDKDEALMQNEFQAYMLMDGAEEARLAALVPMFETRMFTFLTKK